MAVIIAINRQNIEYKYLFGDLQADGDKYENNNLDFLVSNLTPNIV